MKNCLLLDYHKSVVRRLTFIWQIKYEKRDTIIDPKYKIYKRFNKFANKLISQYKDLVTLYEPSLTEIETTRGSDDAQDLITMTISDIHEAVMGNRECSFEIKSKQSGRSKTPLDINLRIYDDGSHSVDRTKVFIYDMALMFNEYTRNRHPLFLVHDNIFDVDQDTLVQCLNYVYKQEEYYSDFQYILTLNRDKIENEERRKLISMDVDAHEVAFFTKVNKFLKKNYQEK